MIGTVQAFALACGFLFVSLYQGFLHGLTGLLFGSITGVSDGQVLTLLVAGAGCLVVLAVLGRPLLFASVDPEVARARGVPVRLVGAAFLVLLGGGRGRRQPDHRQPAGVRAAGRPGRHRQPAYRPSGLGPRAVGADRGRGHLARRGHRVLLPVPDRFLGDHAGVRGVLLAPGYRHAADRRGGAGAGSGRPARPVRA